MSKCQLRCKLARPFFVGGKAEDVTIGELNRSENASSGAVALRFHRGNQGKQDPLLNQCDGSRGRRGDVGLISTSQGIEGCPTVT